MFFGGVIFTAPGPLNSPLVALGIWSIVALLVITIIWGRKDELH